MLSESMLPMKNASLNRRLTRLAGRQKQESQQNQNELHNILDRNFEDLASIYLSNSSGKHKNTKNLNPSRRVLAQNEC